MNFDSILDQDTAVRALRSSIKKNRVAHAYLFIGPSGVGRKLAATAFAQSLNCEHAREGNACGTCNSCRLISEGKHPDVQTIMPTKRSSTITVDQVRDLLPFAYMRPLKGKSKVFVFCEADRLGAASANKLLKTLEEPPPLTTFVLITDRPDGILPTVASRCQPIKFGRLSAESVAFILETKFGVDSELAAVAAELANGQVTRGLQFADPARLDALMAVVKSLGTVSEKIQSHERLLAFLADAREQLQERAESAIPIVEEQADTSERASVSDLRKSFVSSQYRDLLNDCLGLLLTYFRDIMVLKETNAENLVINRNRLDELRERAGTMKYPVILENMENIERAAEYCSHYVAEDRVFLDLLLNLRNA